jgi:hypothetical protein
MIKQIRSSGWAAGAVLMLLSSQTAFAGVCLWGECSEMTNEFRSMELRPKSIALLPARSTLTENGTFNSENRVGETAGLEDALANSLEKEISGHGYTIRRLTFDEIGQDQQLSTLLNAANQRYDEEYATIVAFKVKGVRYRRYSVGEEGRLLAKYLGVDAVAFPRMQIVGSSSGAKWMAGLGATEGQAGGINMEFGLVHARTGDIEALFGGVSKSSTGPMGGVSFKKILKKGDKYMQDIAETATKKLPDFDEVLKPQKLDEEATELVLYDEVDEEAVLDDMDELLGEE